MSTIDIKIIKPTRRYPIAGAIVNTEVDSDGVIKDKFLRRRLKDSAIDGCVEVVDSKPEIKQVNQPKKEDK